MTTPLRDRLDGLAASGVEGIALRRPDHASARVSRRPRYVLRLALVAFAAVLGTLLWIAVRDHDRLDTIDSAPTTPTWPDPRDGAISPQGLPPLVITAPGYTATSANESADFGGPPSTGAASTGESSVPGYLRIYRSVDDPWSIIEVETWTTDDDQAQGTCTVDSMADVVVTEVCEFSGDQTRFEVGFGGTVADVEGLNVSPDEVRAFVDDIGGIALFNPDAAPCCQEVPAGWESLGAGWASGEFIIGDREAEISFAGPGEVELSLQSGTALTAYDELLSFALDNPEHPVTIHQIGDRVVALAGSSDGPRLFWMEGDNVVGIMQAEFVTDEDALDLVRSLEIDAAVWEALLAQGQP
ncbi:MAG: hypothetical protein JNK12_07425 [Acidimicrobiales bacterium]|nr:hypothetical protein [Acidimicrobiales bacterium]